MKIYPFVLIFMISISAFSQEEASNWYFGNNAGLHFDTITGEVTSLNGGQLDTLEGCASISDSNGTLLFYTDGISVWDRNHNLMPNGQGLLGHPSSTQSAIIIPKPNHPTIYYIFTVDTLGLDLTEHDGLNYSEVDMSLNNGNGEVTVKNVNLLPVCTEKLSAVVKDCDSNAIWVVTFASATGTNTTFNSIHAFEVLSSGVNPSAIVSTFEGLNINNYIGYLKLSPDGKNLAIANEPSAGVDLLQFETSNGIASNPIKLQISGDSNQPYGVEFSPDSQLLYITSATPGNSDVDALLQFNLNASNINDSQVLIKYNNLNYSALQLGPNGKIYRTIFGTPYLGVINDPNSIGANCNYEHNAVSLSPNNATWGLPPFIQSYFKNTIDIIRNNKSSTYLSLCDGKVYTLSVEDIPNATFEWYKDDIILTENDFDYVVTQPGTYKVIVTLTDTCETLEGIATVEYFQNPIVQDAVLKQCDDDNDGIVAFNLNEVTTLISDNSENENFSFYHTLEDAENAQNAISNSTAYPNIDPSSNPDLLFVRVENANECYSIAVLYLTVSTTQIPNDFLLTYESCDDGTFEGFSTFDFSNATAIIENLFPTGQNITVSYYESIFDALAEENPILDISNHKNTLSPYIQDIYVRVDNNDNNACLGLGKHIQLVASSLPNLQDDETVLYCSNSYPKTITLNSGLISWNTTDYSFSWSTGETAESIKINELGNYTVTVTNNLSLCSNSRNITVAPSSTATIEIIEVVDASSNNTISVLVSGEGEYVYALYKDDILYRNFQTDNTFYNVDAGIYTVSIKDYKGNCGTINDRVSVIGFPSFFTPNNDGINDEWVIKGVLNQFLAKSKVSIYNRYGKLLKQLNSLDKGWDGNYKGVQLPSDDYWFNLTLYDGRTLMGHFSLKR